MGLSVNSLKTMRRLNRLPTKYIGCFRIVRFKRREQMWENSWGIKRPKRIGEHQKRRRSVRKCLPWLWLRGFLFQDQECMASHLMLSSVPTSDLFCSAYSLKLKEILLNIIFYVNLEGNLEKKIAIIIQAHRDFQKHCGRICKILN